MILFTEEGKTEEQKQKLSADITLGISTHFKIPEQAVRVIFQELRENRIASGGLLEPSPKYKTKKKLAQTQNTELEPE